MNPSSVQSFTAGTVYHAHNNNSNEGNSYIDQLKMSATYDRAKADVGSMDEMQFNESLDALLDGENLNTDSSSGPTPYSVPESTAQPAQGLLTNHLPVGSMGQQAGGAMGVQAPVASYSGSAPVSHVSYPGVPTYPSMAGQQPMYGHTQLAKPVPSADASSVTSSTPSRSSGTRSRKHGRDVSAVSEDEEDRVRRRQDRNIREQQRSQKITQQIDHLRDVLASANVQFKPDKYSTLVSVAEYIQQLQEKSALLDAEHKKLTDTISRTNDMVNNAYIPAFTNGADAPGSAKLEGTTSNEGQDGECYLPNIDYHTIFSRCGVPLAVLSIDGRFLECNQGFERLTGYTREELLPCEKSPAANDPVSTASRNMSLFNLLSREHMEAVFFSMSEMLKQAPGKGGEKAGEGKADAEKPKDYWSGTVCLSRNMQLKMHMNVSLVRTPQGRAKFFNCSMMEVNDAFGEGADD